MQRYFIELAYNGTGYHGWQIQPNALTVQECLDKALSVYFRQPISTLGCGRTDAGVHATQFYAHFDLSAPVQNLPAQNLPAQKLPFGAGDDQSAETSQKHSAQTDYWLRAIAGVNSLLPYDIAVRRIFAVAADAHARFDATERAYHYHLHFQKDPFKLDRSWLYKGQLNVEAMNEAAAVLKEYIDFSCFSKSNTQTFTNNCRIREAFFERTSDGLKFTIRADRFLRNMVRAIVGTLIRIGRNEISILQFREIIESKSRSSAGQSVPACGLYLVSVIYPYLT